MHLIVYYIAIYFYIIFVDSTTEIEEKALHKRQKITPFEVCESADDTDSSMIGKTEDKVITVYSLSYPGRYKRFLIFFYIFNCIGDSTISHFLCP